MEQMDGMTAAGKIREIDSDVIIIFVTNMADFAISGYKVDALSYVVKPVLYVDFVQQLNKAVKRIEFGRRSYLLVKSKSEILRLDIAKISYLESVEHKVVIHLEDEDLIIYSTLGKLENNCRVIVLPDVTADTLSV